MSNTGSGSYIIIGPKYLPTISFWSALADNSSMIYPSNPILSIEALHWGTGLHRLGLCGALVALRVLVLRVRGLSGFWGWGVGVSAFGVLLFFFSGLGAKVLGMVNF